MAGHLGVYKNFFPAGSGVKFQYPNPKFQIISKFQTSNGKPYRNFWSLSFWEFFGFWCLGFGASESSMIFKRLNRYGR
jgi:hypothetical protein